MEIAESGPKSEKWTPKPKERTRVVKNRFKNVYKLLEVVNALPNILAEVIALLDYSIFFNERPYSFQSDGVFSLEHSTNLLSHLFTLQRPLTWKVNSKITLQCRYMRAKCTKVATIRELVSQSVDNYFKNYPMYIDETHVKKRGPKLEKIIQHEILIFFTRIVLLSVSSNYVDKTECEFEDIFVCDCLHPFEYGSFAPANVFQQILDIVETHTCVR